MMLMKSPMGSLKKVDLEARFFYGLADPTRLAILNFLVGQERSVNEIAAYVGSSQSCISNHLTCLRNGHFVCVRQEGCKVYYSLRHSDIRELIKLAEKLVRSHAQEMAKCCGE